jgi:hypothetical protein
MNILGSHLHLIQELRFDVTFSSSLPSVSTDFHGSATILKRLELQCKEDDGGLDHFPLPANHSQAMNYYCLSPP